MARKTWVQCQVQSYQRLKKWYLKPPCLTLSIIRYGSRIKWSNPWKGVPPFPTPWCSSYRKGSHRVTLDYVRQLYLLFISYSIVLFSHSVSISGRRILNSNTAFKLSSYSFGNKRREKNYKLVIIKFEVIELMTLTFSVIFISIRGTIRLIYIFT